MVYGRYNYSIHGVYKPTYNWGAPSCTWWRDDPWKYMGVSENVVYPIVPNGFADHYPYEKLLFHWEYSLFSDKAIWWSDDLQFHLSGYQLPPCSPVLDRFAKKKEKLNVFQDLAFRIPSIFASNPDDRGYYMGLSENRVYSQWNSHLKTG